MLLIDVITSALPPQTGFHAKDHQCAYPRIGPHIGLTWFRLAGGTQVSQGRFEYPYWLSFRSTTLGILGMNAVGLAVARDAFGTARANIIYHHAEPVAEAESTCAARLVSFGSVLLADAICVALPWTDGAEGLLRALRLDRVNSGTICVAWLRSPAIERALAHLKQNYPERVELRDLAAVAGMSKFHFVRAFTAILGVTPHRYQLLLRLAKAKAMLHEGSEIAQVAVHAGFWDQSHFDRSFRLFVGMTPTQYQKNALA
jgi:AraC-like DNA-binding protein